MVAMPMVMRVPTTFHLYIRGLEGAKLRISSRKRRFDRRSKEGDTLGDLLSLPRERRFIWLRTRFRNEAGSQSCSGRNMEQRAPVTRKAKVAKQKATI